MGIRWLGVIIGFVVDVFLSQLIASFSSPTFAESPDLAQTGDVVVLVLLILSTGVGGYIAGRMAERDQWLNGLMVGITGILVGQLAQMFGSGPPNRIFVIASAVGCVLGAIGGYIGQFPQAR